MTKVKKDGFREIVQYHCALVKILEITIFLVSKIWEKRSVISISINKASDFFYASEDRWNRDSDQEGRRRTTTNIRDESMKQE